MSGAGSYEAYRYPASHERALRRKIDLLRHRGYRGGIILTHRALLTSVRHPSKLFQALVLLLVFEAGWLFSLNTVSALWAGVLDFWRDTLGIGGYVVLLHYDFLGFFRIDVPYFPVSSGSPDFTVWWAGALGTVVLLFTSILLPERMLPVSYVLRIAAFFQGCSQLFFALAPGDFPYAASGYVHGMFIGSIALLSLFPLILAFTFYVLDLSFMKKLLLTVILMGYLVVFTPFQFMAHAYVLYEYSLLFLPVLFFVFGLPLDLMMFMALYSWGASWKNLYDRDEFMLPRPGGTVEGGE